MKSVLLPIVTILYTLPEVGISPERDDHSNIFSATSSTGVHVDLSASGILSLFAGVSNITGAIPTVTDPSGRPPFLEDRDLTIWCTAAFMAPYVIAQGVGPAHAAAPGRTKRPPGVRKREAKCDARTDDCTEDEYMACKLSKMQSL
jgi:hypothetical protein